MNQPLQLEFLHTMVLLTYSKVETIWFSSGVQQHDRYFVLLDTFQPMTSQFGNADCCAALILVAVIPQCAGRKPNG